jgi:hypothetical protein
MTLGPSAAFSEPWIEPRFRNLGRRGHVNDTAALTREWSTMLNGNSYDMVKFQKQVSGAVAAN